MKRFYLFLLISFSIPLVLSAQNTVGLLDYKADQASEGYNFFFPHNQGTAFLIDNCGEIVHSWADVNYRPGNGAYIHTNGNVYLNKSRGAISNSYIHAGGGGELLDVLDWDNNLLWQFVYNDSLKRMHHDIAVMPNGNALILAWERKTEAEALAAGRDSTFLTDNELWPEHIVEVEPDGMGGANIIWEWHVWDHLIQDFDNTKANFGVVADHPELINLNYGLDGSADWQHANSIDYNPYYDQILISIPTFGEVWIIDHSTTTAQAASHSGGLSGIGGDLLYRWGNPAAYDRGTEADQKLFYQHDAHWVDQGLDANHPDFLKVAAFNNRVGADYSTAVVFAPTWTGYDGNYPLNGQTWDPVDFDWTYTAPTPQDMYSNILSSIQLLPNLNKLISLGRPGYSFELNPSNEIVWAYKNPMNSGNPVAQGANLPLSANLHFRMKRYASDYAGFAGKNLSPNGYIELNPDTTYCDRLVSIVDIPNQFIIKAFPNPSSDYIQIVLEGEVPTTSRLEVFNILGHQVFLGSFEGRNAIQIDVKSWATGVYWLRINGEAAGRIVRP